MSAFLQRRLWVLLLMAAVVAAGTAVWVSSLEPVKAGCMPGDVPPDVILLDPLTIPQYVDPLPIPKVMPAVAKTTIFGVTASAYDVSARQIEEQMLPTTGFGPGGTDPFPKTKLFAYGPKNNPALAASPAMTFEVRKNERTLVRWNNDLVDAQGKFIPHFLSIDQTIHWAAPNAMHHSMPDPCTYEGPVPIVTHLHGAHVADHSDGYPESWYLPKAGNIPDGYTKKGPNYTSVIPAPEGSAYYLYSNDQLATTLWYHDHTLGMTRVNVYAGLAGFYLIRDSVEDGLKLPGPAAKAGDAPGKDYYEIPLMVQDKAFNPDGSLFFPTGRAFFEGVANSEFTIPTTPTMVGDKMSDIAPIWNPEFFGNVIMVNGKTWPYLNVEPRRYRFRLLNAANARAFTFKMENGRPFWQIGTDGGLVANKPVKLFELTLMPGERADVIVDFTGMAVGSKTQLLNISPDEPFGGPNNPATPADPATTGKVMQFRIVALKGKDNSANPATLKLPAHKALPNTTKVRDLTLNEASSTVIDVDGNPLVEGAEPFGPRAAFLGTAADGPLKWMDPITEKPKVGATEIWRLNNLTVDAHPIHLHLVQFKILDRTPFDADAFGAAQAAYLAGPRTGPVPNPAAFVTGPVEAPLAYETGWKDTVVAWPAYITRVKAKFDMKGLYVWHCHILDHEDNEMMRPYEVVK